MWIYQKQLEYPVNITKPDVKMAKLLMAQYGGPDSELGAALRYLTQRYSMPSDRVRATLTDIGTEELAHWEMIAAMVHQCMQGASCEELTAAGLDGYYIMHNHGVYPCDPNGVPFTAAYIQCTGDPVADLVEDMAAEQKARVTYEHLMNMTDNSQINTTVEYSLKIGSSTKRTDVAAFNDCVERQNNILWIIESKQKDDFVKCIELKGVSKKCNNYFFSNQGLAISRVDRWRVSNV